MTTPKLLLVKAGDTLEEVKSTCGDFDRMFLGPLAELGVVPRVVSPHRGERLPPAEAFDAMIITGSPHSVTARDTWADQLAKLLVDAVASDRFVLGVCYGHQLLAHAL